MFETDIIWCSDAAHAASSDRRARVSVTLNFNSDLICSNLVLPSVRYLTFFIYLFLSSWHCYALFSILVIIFFAFAVSFIYFPLIRTFSLLRVCLFSFFLIFLIFFISVFFSYLLFPFTPSYSASPYICLCLSTF